MTRAVERTPEPAAPGAQDSPPPFPNLTAEAQARFGAAYTPRGRRRLQAAALERQTRLGLASPAAYEARLAADPGEWSRLWPLALDSSGAFLQPAAQFEIAGEILKEWAISAPERVLRVLSLGCGPGFETAALAITLEEAGFRFKNWQVSVLGLDLNPEAAARAEAGLFQIAELAGLKADRRRKWFVPRGGGLFFKTELAPPLRLAAANAYEPDAWPEAGPFELIFCRGLTREAPPAATARLAEILSAVLAPSGFIFTAPGEFLPAAGDLFLEERAGAVWYRRGVRRFKAAAPRRARATKTLEAAPEPATPEPAMPAQLEAALLAEAESLLASGRLDEARDLADEALYAALEQGRPAWAAWAFLARWEAALDRPPSLAPQAD